MSAPASSAPVVEIDPVALDSDPYPIYAELRRDAPLAFVPMLGSHLVTRHADVSTIAADADTFSSVGGGGTPGDEIVGETVMNKDGDQHRAERRSLDAPLKASIVRDRWSGVFDANARDLLSRIADRGEADLLADFARPLAAANLLAYLGFAGVSTPDLIDWCEGIINAAGNYVGDPDVRAHGLRARAAVVAAVDAAVARVSAIPDDSVISAMVHSGHAMASQHIYSNIMITIGGGVNEPSHALSTATYALLTQPDQREALERSPALWERVFEEAVRWVSPIGMLQARRVTRPVEVAGVELQPGDQVSSAVASANRDERIYPIPDTFDLWRPSMRHLAFGKGPHFCAGAPMARSQVGIALPMVFQQLRGLRLDLDHEVPWRGFIFRGPVSLHVRWDA
jgi:cytochrome P450